MMKLLRLRLGCCLTGLLAFAALAPAAHAAAVGVSFAECMASPNARSVADFGGWAANDPSASVAATNQQTINRAIDTVGASGGGTICLPPGRFHIAFSTGFSGISASNSLAIFINRSNITLWGDGIANTILLTPPDYRLVNGAVVRGTGLWISAPGNQITRNITLRHFQLDGQAGWTGRYGFPANPTTGDGWDITHKGVMLSQGRYVDNVLLEDFHVRRYKGEIIYAGGERMGRLRLNRVKSEDTNASTYNATAQAIVENSEFGLSKFWIEIGTAFENKSGVFRNNYFHDSRNGQGITLTQGDAGVQPYTFSGNLFERCQGVFGFYGGVGGEIRIVDNMTNECGGDFLQFGSAPNTVVPGLRLTKNVVAERNTVMGGTTLARFYTHLENIMIRDNVFVGPADPSQSNAIVVGTNGNFKDVVVLKNRFSSTRPPTYQATTFLGEQPLFSGNTYSQQASQVVVTGTTVFPRYEFFQVHMGGGGNVQTITLNTAQIPDGQIIEVSGGSPTRQVRFSAGASNGYALSSERILTGTQRLLLRFDGSANIWREYRQPARSVAYPSARRAAPLLRDAARPMRTDAARAQRLGGRNNSAIMQRAPPPP